LISFAKPSSNCGSFCDPRAITRKKASNIANGAGLNVCLINARGAQMTSAGAVDVGAYILT